MMQNMIVLVAQMPPGCRAGLPEPHRALLEHAGCELDKSRLYFTLEGRDVVGYESACDCTAAELAGAIAEAAAS